MIGDTSTGEIEQIRCLECGCIIEDGMCKYDCVFDAMPRPLQKILMQRVRVTTEVLEEQRLEVDGGERA